MYVLKKLFAKFAKKKNENYADSNTDQCDASKKPVDEEVSCVGEYALSINSSPNDDKPKMIKQEEMQNDEIMDNVPSIYIDEKLLRDYKFPGRSPYAQTNNRTYYEINGASFWENDTNMKDYKDGDKLLEFKLIDHLSDQNYGNSGTEVTEADRSSLVPKQLGTDLSVVINHTEYGLIINSIVLLTENAWNTIICEQNDHLCVVCNRILDLEVADHIASSHHEDILARFRPVEEYDISIVRKIKDIYHCAVCNVTCVDVNNHLESLGHGQELMTSINKVLDITTNDIDSGRNENVNANDSINRNDIVNDRVCHSAQNDDHSHRNEKEDLSNDYTDIDSGRTENVNVNDSINRNDIVNDRVCHSAQNDDHSGRNEKRNLSNDYISHNDIEASEFDDESLDGFYDDCVFEKSNKPDHSSFSYAAIAKKPKVFTNEKYVRIEINGKCFTVTFESWNMIIVIEKNKFYCMACKESEHIRYKYDHCRKVSHVEGLMKCTTVSAFKEYVIRKVDDKHYHCGHCNNLQVKHEMTDHIEANHVKKNVKPKINAEAVVSCSNKKYTGSPKPNDSQNMTKLQSISPIKTDSKAGIKSIEYKVASINPRTEKAISDATLKKPHENIIENEININQISNVHAKMMPNSRAPSQNQSPNQTFNPKPNKPEQALLQGASINHLTEQSTPQVSPLASTTVITVYGLTLRVSLLAYNLIHHPMPDVYICLICGLKSAFDVWIHISDPVHKTRIEAIPFIPHTSFHSIRSTKSGFQCVVCNIFMNNPIEHTWNPVHLDLLRRAICQPEPIRSTPQITSNLNENKATTSIENTNKCRTKNNVENAKYYTDNIENHDENKTTKSVKNSKKCDTKLKKKTESYVNVGNYPNEEMNNDIAYNDTDSANKEIDSAYNVIGGASKEIDSASNEIDSASNETKKTENDEKEFDTEECVYVKIKTSYIKISLTSYNGLVIPGDGTRYCVFCEKAVIVDSLKEHVSDLKHLKNIEKHKFVEKFEKHLFRQIIPNYHCALCNVIVSENLLNDHISWAVHKEIEANKTSKHIRHNEVKSGIKVITCTTQKRIDVPPQKDSKIEILFNFEFCPRVQNVVKKKKVVTIDGAVLTLSWDGFHGVCKHKNGYKCIICQTDFKAYELSAHVGSSKHLEVLESSFVIELLPALMRKINNSTLHCVTCNMEIKNADNAIENHVDSNRHIKNYASTVTNESDTELDKDILELKRIGSDRKRKKAK